jgi:chromate reductase, NAD(P)H dehydrogenase (quinone)
MAKIVGIAGSLRKASYNALLLRAASEVAPQGTEIELASIAEIPLFDQDELDRKVPEPVARLKERVAAADGLLLVTPEYNHSLPGVLKNVIDWLSRPVSDIPRLFNDKPVAVIGASTGPGGTRLAQAAWLPVLRVLGTRPFFGKPIYVAGAATAFDGDGKLADEATRRLLSEFIAGFSTFAAR